MDRCVCVLFNRLCNIRWDSKLNFIPCWILTLAPKKDLRSIKCRIESIHTASRVSPADKNVHPVVLLSKDPGKNIP